MGQSCEGLELSLTQKGTVRQTMSNCVKALQSDQRTKGMFRYNMFTNKIEVLNALNNLLDDTQRKYVTRLINEEDPISAAYIAFRAGMISGKRIERAKKKKRQIKEC